MPAPAAPPLNGPRCEPLEGPPAARGLPPRDGYGLWASSYDDDPNPLLALEERKLGLLLPDMREKQVVDLGCGTGRWMRKLVRAGARSALGLDFTEEMLRRAAQDPQLKPQLVLGNCLMLPLRSRVAELVMLSFTLAHIRDLAAVAREIAHITRPGGEVFISDLHPEAIAAGWRCAFRYQGTRVEIDGCHHQRAGVQSAFRSAGFGLRLSLDCFVGEPERHIFIEGGKGAMFEAARAVPAVAIDHFILCGRRVEDSTRFQHQDSKSQRREIFNNSRKTLPGDPGFF